MIKDAADLFAVRGEEAKNIIENLTSEAKDALDLALSEAPKASARERYRYAKERIFPLLARIEDAGERGAALKDVAEGLKLGLKELRTAFEEFNVGLRPLQEHDVDDGEEGEDLLPEPGTERHERAMELLRSQNILQRASRDMERLGHVGEPTAKELLFICAVSAKAGLPVQPAIHAESSAGKNHLADTVLSLLPPEMVISRSAVSGKALFYTDAELRGRVIYLQEVVGSEDADFVIRILQSAQYIEYEVTEKTADGSFHTVTYRKEGPVVVVQTTTAIRLFHENDTRVFPVYVDESPEQTRRIVDHAKLRAATGGPSPEEQEAIYTVWHDAIRLLEPAGVIVPYAGRIEVPIHRVRVRRDINRLLDVIRIVAWLNQHNRARDEKGRILATEEDFRVAAELVADPLQRAWKSLTPAEQAVMEAVESLKESLRINGFTRNDLVVEGHDKRRIQDALKALTETGYLDRDGKRGPRGYRYTVSRSPENSVPGVRLHPAGNEGGEGATEADSDNEGEEEDGEERGSRESTRNDIRAIESGELHEEDAIARSREEADENAFADYKPEDEEAVDHISALTERGWYRAETAFRGDDTPEDYSVDDDPVARRLRHDVGIFKGSNYSWKTPFYQFEAPWVRSAEELFELGPEKKNEEEQNSAEWPASPGQMVTRLERVIPQLQSKARPFWDLGLSDWYAAMQIDHPLDLEKVCKPAHLHAELWRNEHSGEELWALVALQDGWRVPDEAIEEAVWRRVTYGPRASEDNELDAPPGQDVAFEL